MFAFIKRYIRALTLFATGTSIVMLFGCASPGTNPASLEMKWQGLEDAQPVYGIVRLTVNGSGNDIISVNFSLDGTGEEHFLSRGRSDNASVYSCDWFTRETTNGPHRIYARASGSGGVITETSIQLIVGNSGRAASIPDGVQKMTPANDSAPPQLSPFFRTIWNDPMPLGNAINTAGAEDSPFITPDGNTLYFWFNADELKDEHQQVNDPMTGIWVSQKVNGEWEEAQRLFLQYFDRTGYDGAPTVRNNRLWFASIREGNYRDIDIWLADEQDGKWVNWANAGELFNKKYQVGELHVTADLNEIYFDSSRADGNGGKDIWVTRKISGEWQAPENIGIVNTPEDEGQPFVSDDGNELWFTRLTPGPVIYRSIKVNGEWQAPELVVFDLAGEPTLDMDGNLYFVHHRWDGILNRVTEADIYVCYRK